MKPKPEADEWTRDLLDNIMNTTGMTESELSCAAGQSEDWVKRVKNNETDLTLMDCYHICRVLNLDMCQLFDINKNK